MISEFENLSLGGNNAASNHGDPFTHAELTPEQQKTLIDIRRRKTELLLEIQNYYKKVKVPILMSLKCHLVHVIVTVPKTGGARDYLQSSAFFRGEVYGARCVCMFACCAARCGGHCWYDAPAQPAPTTTTMIRYPVPASFLILVFVWSRPTVCESVMCLVRQHL
uniref:SFRICE_016484 n=1 Tax=Spodoptera frugiperda TaxID=7108 RepID=A0A2H1V5N3_SPOFR